MSLGVKASNKGFDVNSAADYRLSFSSEWPLLKIESQGSFSIADTSLDVEITSHSLGYNPMFWVFDTSTAGQTEFIGGDSVFCGINTTSLYWLGASNGVPAGTATGYYYIFRYNMETEFTAGTLLGAEDTPTADNDFGIKIAKPGKDVSSTDLRDFVMRTDCFSPQIHLTDYGTESSFGWTQTIPHDLGYEPMFHFYMKNDGQSYYQIVGASDQERKSRSDTTDLVISAIPKGTWFVSIFKDPYEYGG